MAKHPVFPMWIQDYLADTSHLDATEHGVYHLLLYRYWLTECRPLPDDMAFLRRVTRCRSSAKLRSILEQFWKLSTGEGWHHRRAQREFRVTRERSYVQREKAKKRWKINDDSNAAADAAAMPPTPTPEEEEETTIPSLLSQDSGSESRNSSRPQTKKSPVDLCPHQAIIELYHEKTPCRRVRTWNGQRPKLLRSAWREHPDLDWWAGFFEYVAESDFLCGKCQPANGRAVFMADLEWLIRPQNFQKVNEGKYHGIRQTNAGRNQFADLH